MLINVCITKIALKMHTQNNSKNIIFFIQTSNLSYGMDRR